MEELDKLKEEVAVLQQKEIQELERISGLTSEEAKEYLFRTVENQVKMESAILIKDIESKAKMEAEKKAREIITNAIQKCAADHVADTTVSVVPLPNDEMKGELSGVKEGIYVHWKL